MIVLLPACFVSSECLLAVALINWVVMTRQQQQQQQQCVG